MKRYHPEERFVSEGARTWLGNFWVATNGHVVKEIAFGVPAPLHEEDDALGRDVARQIREFLEGERRAFDIPLDWSVMPPAHSAILKTLYETIRWGDVITYGELAAMAGYPGAARAAGTACRMNPFAIVVPAHRVIAAHNRLGGFLGRPDLKRRLLAREGSGPFRD
jgi:methylated-DNA-[protein]-cysteine S-methyltransferase